MKMNKLGQTDIEVSNLCLGSMTWGTQNTADEAHEQINVARGYGVNFIDTAEMYPVNPVKGETVGRTERIIGLYFEEGHSRHDLIVATKHSGQGLDIVRDGAPISSKTISNTIDGSLRRLKTDYIDLYQFHWPNRGSYMFRQNWSYDPSGNDRAAIRQDMEDCIGALQAEVDRGRIRAFGLSNESVWGTMSWIDVAERLNGPRVATVQNEYSMLCRMYDTDMAEMSVLEDVGLLAFSPLATGFLTGKYQNGEIPDGSRMSLSPMMGGRKTKRVFSAVNAYEEVADNYGLDLAQMSLAWCLTRPFMCSAIFGATTQDQLKTALGAADVKLGADILADIDMVHQRYPMPF